MTYVYCSLELATDQVRESADHSEPTTEKPYMSGNNTPTWR